MCLPLTARTQDFERQTFHGHKLQASVFGHTGDFSTGRKEIRKGTQTHEFQGGSLGGVDCKGEQCTVSAEHLVCGFGDSATEVCKDRSQETRIFCGDKEVLLQTAQQSVSTETGQVQWGSEKRITKSFLMSSKVTGSEGSITDHGMTFRNEASTTHVLDAGGSSLQISGAQAAKLKEVLPSRSSRNLLMTSSSQGSTAADIQAAFQRAGVSNRSVKNLADGLAETVKEASTHACTGNLLKDALSEIGDTNTANLLLKNNQKALMKEGFGVSDKRSQIAIERGHEAKYQVLATRGAEEIGHGKISSSESSGSGTGSTSRTRDVMGSHQHVMLDEYGLAEMSTCYGRAREVVTTTSHEHPQHAGFWSSSREQMTCTTDEQIDGVIRSISVAGKARADTSSGALLQRFTAQGDSYQRSWGVFTKEQTVNVVEQRSGTVQDGKRSLLKLVSQQGLQEEYDACIVDYRRKTVRLDSGAVTLSDEGLFLRTERSGKGSYDASKKEITLDETSSTKTSLSSHSCQGVAGGVGGAFRHFLNGGKLDMECAKAAAKGAAFSWSMSVVTQTFERRVAGSGSAAFAVINAAQQSLAALRDPTQTKKAKATKIAGETCKAIVVWGALRVASKRMMVSAASVIVPIVEIGGEAVRSIRLYMQGDITWNRLMCNLGNAVVAGTGTGFGGYCGFVLGALLGPVCAAVGAVVGGALGEWLASRPTLRDFIRYLAGATDDEKLERAYAFLGKESGLEPLRPKKGSYDHITDMEINQYYRAASKKLHPDKHAGPDKEEYQAKSHGLQL